MSQERREKRDARLRAEMAKPKVGPTGKKVPRPVYLTTPDGNRNVPPQTIVCTLVREEGMGFAVVMTDKGLFRAKEADHATPGRWHEIPSGV